MATLTIICLIHWVLLYFSSQLLSLKADNCSRPDLETCGNLTLRYPFRLNQSSCGLPGFEITCRGKSSFNPGIPYLKTLGGEVEVRNISDDHILVDAVASYALPCTNNDVKAFNLSDEGPLRISEANNFFSVGCGILCQFQTSLAGGADGYTGTSEPSCNQTRTVKPWDCKDNSCGKIPIPGGYTEIIVKIKSYPDDCNYSVCAVVDQDSFGSNPESKFQLQGARYSMRLDWAIPNNSYSSARLGNISDQCAQNATGQDKGWGYLCKCNSNFTGDGYINGTGCNEIKKCTGSGCFQTLSVIAGVCGTLVAVLLGGGLLWIFMLWKSRREKERNFKRNGGDRWDELISSRGGLGGLKLFSLNEIAKATKKFSPSLILGIGWNGTYFKGTLTDQRVVAIKKFKEVDYKEIYQFIVEAFELSRINRGNVVKLLGCCLETSVPLLVYEYISNGTLFDHLHSKKKEAQQQLSWEQRLCIATETAEALSHLHSATPTPIVHRDVKSSNILLDKDYNPKVGDFGVSSLLPMGETNIAKIVKGTMGYIDPKYFQSFQLNEKSDVYSFGVVLVELLTGSKPVSYIRKKNQSNLAIFFLSTVNKRGFRELVDPSLDVDEAKNMESMIRVARLAKECLNIDGEKRPSMKEVFQELLRTKDGERPQAGKDEADNPHEMVEAVAAEEERKDGIRSTQSTPPV